jgi:hypothetical protein
VCIALIRTTVATLIAFAVALLPVSGNSIPLLPLSSPPPEVTMADHADMPCCPSCDTQGDFKACALKCAALASAVLPATSVAPLYIAEGSLRELAEDALHTHVIAPTHPPPI